MDRYGDSQFRPQGQGGYPRQTGSGRGSGILGQMPTRRAQGYQDSQYSPATSQQGYNNKPQWKPSQSTGILGASPKREYGRDDGNYNKPAPYSNQARNQANPARNAPVPNEVRKLMQTLGLSQSDMQKLSQLPEKDLSHGNLARAIGNLRQQKERANQGPANNSDERRFESSNADNNYQDSYDRSDYQNDNRNRGSFDNNNYNNYPSRQQDSGRMAPQNRPKTANNDLRNDIYPNNSARNKPTGVKVTIKPSDSMPSGRFRDQGYYDNRQDRGEYYSDSNRRSDYADNQSNDRFDSYSENNHRDDFNKPVNNRQGQNYGNNRNYNNQRPPDNRSGPGPVGLPRNQGVRGIQKPAGNNIPSLLGINVSPSAKLMTPASNLLGVSSGLLGNPMQPSSIGLDSLAAQVRTPVNAVSQAASLLNPLLLASQAADPNVLEAQIQAMKVLQAELTRKQQPQQNQGQGNRRDDDRQRPMMRRDRRQSPNRNERRVVQEAREIGAEMRKERGKVLYIRYKSNRIGENDLRKLATAFGRITNLFTIRAKIPNGHHQSFMEMESWDCAAAMLEHYLINPPTIKEGPVTVERSNHKDLRTRHQNNEMKRVRSISPLREGTTQLSRKRVRDEKNGSLNVSVSSENKRVVTKHDDRNDDRKRSRNSKDKNDTKKTDSKDTKSGDKKSNSPRRESRRLSDRRRSDNRKSRWPDKEKENKKGAEDKNKDKKPEKKDIKKEPSVTKNEKTEDTKKENPEKPVKEDKVEVKKEATDIEDPLDAIADEIALAEDFVLMDEVKEKTLSKDEDEHTGTESHPGVDLDSGDMDLENVNVEEARETPQEGDSEEKMEEDHKPDEEKKDVEIDGKVEDQEEEKEKNDEDQSVADNDKSEDPEEDLKDVEKDAATEEETTETIEDESASQNEDDLNDTIEMQESDLGSNFESKSEDETILVNDISQFAVLDSTGCEENGKDEDPTETPPEEEEEDDNKVNPLLSVINLTLEDILEAQTQLVALVKSTKNQKSQVIAKKLKESLDNAVTKLQNASHNNTE